MITVVTMMPPIPNLSRNPFPQSHEIPSAYIGLTVQGNRFTASLIPPQVYVNGWPLPKKYGKSAVPIPAGRCRVDAVAQWTKQYGRASMEFTINPGQFVPVFYAPPSHVFSDGAIGHVKHRRRGLWYPIVALTVSFAVLALSTYLIVSS
jgi:hypothetical protein